MKRIVKTHKYQMPLRGLNYFSSHGLGVHVQKKTTTYLSTDSEKLAEMLSMFDPYE